MITDNLRRLTELNGVSAGGVATLKLPLAARLKTLYLQYKVNANQATIEADITSIVIKINGQPRRVCTPAQINIKEAHQGRPFRAGFIPIRFRDVGAVDNQFEDLTALNTFRLASATVEVSFASGATAPALECWGDWDSVDDKNDFFTVWDAVTFTNSGAGTKTKTDLDPFGIYSRIDFFGTSNLPTNVKIRVDDREIIDHVPAVMNAFAADYGFVDQANHDAVLFTWTRRPAEGLDMVYLDGKTRVRRFEVEYTTAASGDIVAVVERIVKL